MKQKLNACKIKLVESKFHRQIMQGVSKLHILLRKLLQKTRSDKNAQLHASDGASGLSARDVKGKKLLK